MPAIDERTVAAAFARVEGALLRSMVRNLERHRADQEAEGFEWERWQEVQLVELDRYVRGTVRREGSAFEELNRQVDWLIRNAYEAGLSRMERAKLRLMRLGIDLTEGIRRLFGVEDATSLLGVPEERLDSLVRATHSDLARAEHATLRKAEDDYKRIIYAAQTYATSGAATYEQAVDMAVRDFLDRGIRGITYRDGSRHSIREYSRMAIRTAVKRAALASEGRMRQEWGVHTVIVNPRPDACPVCMRWVGKVLVDDVYSGGTREEAEEGGYPLLSEAMAEGLFHPNCRDTATTFFPGITELPPEPTEADLRRARAREEREGEIADARAQERSQSLIAELALDPGNRRMAERRAKEAGERADALATEDANLQNPR